MIEAATEKEEVKRKIFAELCPQLKPDAILGTNTSSISITRLAASTDRPEHFIGIHFMNPVPVMELVELIRGIATDDDDLRGVPRSSSSKLGKTIAVAEDFPAFIVNRILLPMINEAVYTLYEGVGTVEAIDTAMKLGAHHPMGPLELADFIGLDTCLSVMQVLLRGPRRLEVPALPAAGEIRRGRLARPQDQARLLRLSRREAGADAVGPFAGRPSIAASPSAIATMPTSGAAASCSPSTSVAEQDRAHRNQERDQQHVGRAGARQDAEVDHIAERGREQRERRRARPTRSRSAARAAPRPVEQR